MSRKRKKYDFEQPKYEVEIFIGIDRDRPLTTLKPENNYYCKPILISRDDKEMVKGIKEFKTSMKRGNA